MYEHQQKPSIYFSKFTTKNNLINLNNAMLNINNNKKQVTTYITYKKI